MKRISVGWSLFLILALVLLAGCGGDNATYELTQHAFPEGVYHRFDYPFYYFSIFAQMHKTE